MRALIFILSICYGSMIMQAQEYSPVAFTKIDSLLAAEKFEEAAGLIEKNTDYYFKKGSLDSLYAYPLYIGKVAIAKEGNTIAEKKALAFITKLEKRTADPRTLFKTYLSLDKLYLNLADDAKAAAAATKALQYAQQTNDITDEELGRIHYILGGDYYALYDDPKALDNFKKSIYHFEKSPNIAKHTLADSYNGAATGMWVLNKLDSAEVYYRKAIQIARNSDLKGYDKAYYIATFQFNLALVIDDQGRVSDAIAIEKSILSTYQEIIAQSENKELVDKARKREAGAIANLAAFYNDIGYVDRSYAMIKYSYEKKKHLYDSTDPNLASVLTNIAGSEVSLRMFDKSLATVDLAISNLRKASEKYPALEADLFYTKATAFQGKKDTLRTREFFDKSEVLFKKAYPNEYSRRYLLMLREYSQFLAINGYGESAFAKAEKVYSYVSKNAEKSNVTSLNALSNLAEVSFKIGNYKQSLKLAEKGNTILNEELKKATNPLDSLQIAYRRPSFASISVASRYELETNKTTEFLKRQILEIDKAVSTLERRRSTSTSTADVESLLVEYNTLNALAKKMHYDLYDSTKDNSLLDKLLSLQESGVYHRIRTQLNTQEEIRFNKVPEAILKQEKELKESLSLKNMDEAFDIATYLEKQENWTDFLRDLRTDYPNYYTLKYATLDVPIADLQSKIPENTTLLRYSFFEDELFVFLISSTQKELIKLPTSQLKKHITALTENWQDVGAIGTASHLLYKQLWEPFASKITTDHIILVPDGDLYNLSFEMLTDAAIETFGEFAGASLLSRQIISYNFSSLMLDGKGNSRYFDKNYVGFAPEFTTAMKEEYSVQVTDSLAVDKTYLTLLPQPFITEITDEYSRSFKGKSFLNERASKSVFLENAREHKIIHIGTHAESNNLYPELSRLIFAKELNNTNNVAVEDNALYTYEIYNTNLSSNLAILTACETGKPEYQAGEGMISLAHAFTYAGSESILTSLWQIDEQSSAQLVSLFYDNLKDGMSKDKALQQAKLSYLSTAQGRTLAPQYWAGLVLMGNTSPIALSSGIPTWVLWAIGLIVLAILIWLSNRRRNV